MLDFDSSADLTTLSFSLQYDLLQQYRRLFRLHLKLTSQSVSFPLRSTLHFASFMNPPSFVTVKHSGLAERLRHRHGLHCIWQLVQQDSGWFWEMRKRFDSLGWRRMKLLNLPTNVGRNRERRSKAKVRNLFHKFRSNWFCSSLLSFFT